MRRKLSTLNRNINMQRRYVPPTPKVDVARIPTIAPDVCLPYVGPPGWDDARPPVHSELRHMLDRIKVNTKVRIYIDMHQCRCPIMNELHPVPMDNSRSHVVRIELSDSARAVMHITDDVVFIDGVRLKGNPDARRLAIPIDSITRLAYRNSDDLDIDENLAAYNQRPCRIGDCTSGYTYRRVMRVVDIESFSTNVFGADCFLKNFPELTINGVLLQNAKHHGQKVYHVVTMDGKRYNDTSFFTLTELQYLEDVLI